jgi:hypothetical protein
MVLVRSAARQAVVAHALTPPLSEVVEQRGSSRVAFEVTGKANAQTVSMGFCGAWGCGATLVGSH